MGGAGGSRRDLSASFLRGAVPPVDTGCPFPLLGSGALWFRDAMVVVERGALSLSNYHVIGHDEKRRLKPANGTVTP